MHIELGIAGSGIRYCTGDHVAVLGQNNAVLVDRLGARLDIDLDQLFTMTVIEEDVKKKHPFPCPCSFRTALTHYVDITTPPKPHVLRALAEHTDDKKAKEFLLHITSKAGRKEYAAPTAALVCLLPTVSCGGVDGHRRSGSTRGRVFASVSSSSCVCVCVCVGVGVGVCVCVRARARVCMFFLMVHPMLRFCCWMQIADWPYTPCSGTPRYATWVVKEHRTLMYVLEELTSIKPPIDLLLELLPRLQPRYYSISSSPKRFPDTIHVTAVVVR
jgi:sulfite reductase alpha subunit-like flavoprotein